MKEFLIRLVVIGCLSGALWYYYRLAEDRKQQVTEYRQNSNVLASKLKEVYEKKRELEEKNEELEKEAEKDRAVFDWYRDISDSAVVRKLREN